VVPGSEDRYRGKKIKTPAFQERKSLPTGDTLVPSISMSQTLQRMIIESSEAPIWCNLAAAAAQWTVLAGFFILPGTFTSLKEQPQVIGDSRIASTVVNIPLIPLAGICYTVNITGLAIL
jgi:hypothetical protein